MRRKGGQGIEVERVENGMKGRRTYAKDGEKRRIERKERKEKICNR